MSTKRVWYPEGFLMPQADIVQLVDASPMYNYSEITEKASSDWGPGFVGATQASPDVSFRSREIKQILDYCPDNDICGAYHVDPQIPANDYSVRFFCRAGRPFGVREADDFSPSNPVGGQPEDRHHVVDMINSAFLCWESITANQGDAAEISGRWNVAWQDSKIAAQIDPFIWSGTLTPPLPISPVVTSLYTLGPIIVQGQKLKGITSMDWNNNVTREEQLSDGEAFPTLQGIREVAPVVTARSTNLGLWETFMIGTDRRGQRVTDVDVYLRRMDPGQIQYPEAAAQHIQIRLPFALLTVRQMTNSPSEVELNIRGYKAFGAQAFTVTTAVAIP